LLENSLHNHTHTLSGAKANFITMGTTELPWAYSSQDMKLTTLLWAYSSQDMKLTTLLNLRVEG